MNELCPFCEIVEGRAPAEVVDVWSDTVAIVPLNAVVDGHVLIIPVKHAVSVVDDPVVGAIALSRAASFASKRQAPCNLIVSSGAEATQTVEHIHVHYVPRSVSDGLPLPWTPQQQDAHYDGDPDADD